MGGIILFEMVKDIIKKRKKKDIPKDAPKKEEILPPPKEEKKEIKKTAENKDQTYPLECVLCTKQSKTTDKETAEMKKWICWECVDKIIGNKSEVLRCIGKSG